MVLLLGFAFVAGLATCLSPCVLPVLPIALSGGATGGHRRPLGIVTGMVLTFTFATIALTYVIAALGLPNGLMRTLAVAVLLVFGVSLLVPALSVRIQAWLTRFARAPRDTHASGFASGLPLGFSLGLLYTPCAGPILAGVITVSAAQTFTAGRLAVAFAYALGSAVLLYAVMLGGRRFVRPLIARSSYVQQALGALMIAVAVLVSADVDVRFQTAIADDLPAFLTAPADRIQQSEAISAPLAAAHGGVVAAEAGGREAEAGKPLPVVGSAPEFTRTQRWFNTPGGRPLSMAELRKQGRVVLIDFWTYTCINCIRTFPHLKALDEQYRDEGLTIVGVHSPEFPFEKDAGNVAAAIDQNGLQYPVVQDNDLATWDAYKNAYWPADYLIDANGRVRYIHFGEGDYETAEKAVRSLLAEAGRNRLGATARFKAERASPGVATPETYLGAKRAQGFVNGPIVPGRHSFGGANATPRVVDRLPPNALAYRGRWRISGESATALRGASIDLSFGARRVFLVLGSSRGPREMRVLLDGRPIPDRLAGDDVGGATATVSGQRLYRLVELPDAQRHVLTLEPEPGISGYAFTFG